MTCLGPVMRVLEGVGEGPWAEKLGGKPSGLMGSGNRGVDDRMKIPARHLRVTVRVPQA